MREVSARVFGAVLEALQAAGAAKAEVRELEARIAGLGPWVTWKEWADFLERVDAMTEELGGLRGLGEFYGELPSFSYMKRVNALFTNPRFMYSVAGRWIGNSLFPQVRCETEEVGDGRLAQTLSLPQSHCDSPGFFKLMHGALIATPRYLGLPKAHVEIALEPRRAVYTIVPPPSMSLTGRWMRSVRTVLTGGDHEAMKLFAHLIETLQQGSLELERQRALIQARAEALEEALRERDELLAENQRVTDQLQKARDELVFALAEERADPLLLELRGVASHPEHREVLERVLALLRTLPPPYQ